MVHRREPAVFRVATRRYWREADARVMVEAWRQSGTSLSAFIRRYGVHGTHRVRRPKKARSAHPQRWSGGYRKEVIALSA
jgi:hypothetical protein